MNTGVRRFRRFRAENMRIRANALLSADSRLLNISLVGACLEAEQSFASSARQLVRFADEKASLILPCSVVWEEVSDSEGGPGGDSTAFYKAGVSFTPILPHNIVRLKDFIRQSGTPYDQGVNDAYKPSLLRFHVHTNQKAVMYYTRSLPVRKIGLGGMLVEMPGHMRRGRIFLMELVLPDDNRPIRLRCRIASSVRSHDGRPGTVDTGIEFLDMTLPDRFRLSKFLLFSRAACEK